MVKKIFSIILILLCFQVVLANSTPILSNFRVENSQKNRVYFDSNTEIIGSSSNGFIISGKSITGITINSNQTSGHYFTVSSNFDFWDNVTIRYEGNNALPWVSGNTASDIEDLDGNELKDFALTYITNNIAEPASSTIRYASASGSGTQDGTSEANSWSWTDVWNNAAAGMTIWCKAGDYGNGSTAGFPSSGTVNAPIKLVGYKNTPGDISGMYYSYGDGALDTSEMPTITGNNGSNHGLAFLNNSYVIVRNFGFQKLKNGLYSSQATEGLIFENVVSIECTIFDIVFLTATTSSRGRILDCVTVNGNGGIWINSNNTLVKGNKTYGDSETRIVNYYYAAEGVGNIFLDNYARRVGNISHSGHGMSNHVVNGSKNEYTLIENHEVVNISKSIELRRNGSNLAVVRGLWSYDLPGDDDSGGVMIRDNSTKNIIEDSFIECTAGASLFFFESAEPGASMGGDIVIRNNIFKNGTSSGIQVMNDRGGTAIANNVKIYNNTFYNVKKLFNGALGSGAFTNSEFKNNIVHSSSTFNAGSNVTATGWVFDRNSWYNNGFSPQGSNKNTVNPDFVSTVKGGFLPQGALQTGVSLPEVSHDIYGNEVDAVSPTLGAVEIGANEDQDSSTGSENANAGPDISICNGDSGTLTASGGTSYIWNTGETTASIVVSPSSTTTYTVTVSDGTNSDVDQVQVIVNQPPTVNAGADQTICDGEGVTLTATGNGDFLWSTGETTPSITVSPSNTTEYSVTATSAGCQSTAVDYINVIVGEPANLSTTSDLTIQEGESVTLNATGNGTFSWSTGQTGSSIVVSPSTTSSYTVTLTTSDGCTKKNTITVTVAESSNDGSVVAYAGEDVTICSGDQIVLTASGGSEYLWNTGEIERSITVAPNESTIYSVQVTKGEYSDTAYVRVTIDDSCSAGDNKEMVLYPNPTNGLLNIDLLGYENNINIELYSLNGTRVYSQNITNELTHVQVKHQIDLSRYIKGIYLLRLTNKGVSDTQKIMLVQ